MTSVRANLAVLIFSLRKKEACFLNSWKKGVLIFAGASFVRRSWTYLNLFRLGCHGVNKKSEKRKWFWFELWQVKQAEVTSYKLFNHTPKSTLLIIKWRKTTASTKKIINLNRTVIYENKVRVTFMLGLLIQKFNSFLHITFCQVAITLVFEFFFPVFEITNAYVRISQHLGDWRGSCIWILNLIIMNKSKFKGFPSFQKGTWVQLSQTLMSKCWHYGPQYHVRFHIL